MTHLLVQRGHGELGAVHAEVGQHHLIRRLHLDVAVVIVVIQRALAATKAQRVVCQRLRRKSCSCL